MFRGVLDAMPSVVSDSGSCCPTPELLRVIDRPDLPVRLAAHPWAVGVELRIGNTPRRQPSQSHAIALRDFGHGSDETQIGDGGHKRVHLELSRVEEELLLRPSRRCVR